MEEQSEPTEFEIVGAGEPSANGRYILLDACKKGDRSVYVHTENSSYKVQWSTLSSVWMLDYVPGSAPYKIEGRADKTFPLDASWSVYQNGRLPLPKTVYTAPKPKVEPEPEVAIVETKDCPACGFKDGLTNKFCAGCGKKNVCCGERAPASAKFCPCCGQKL